MQNTPPPFSFYFENGTHQSITAPFEWEQIPPFAVITGLNGSGKTHLLSLLNATLREGVGPSGVPPGSRVRVSGLQLEPQDIAFHASLSGLQSTQVGLAHLQEMVTETIELLRNPRPNRRGDEQSLVAAARRDRIAPKVAQRLGLTETSPEAFRAVQPADIADVLELDHFVSHKTDLAAASLELASLFAAHNLRALQRKITSELSIQECLTENGPPPWDTLTGLIRSAGLPYSCISPPIDLLHKYRLELNHDDGTRIVLAALSSGEQVIVGIAIHLLLFGHGKLPKLLLLDEPDAHLHTAVIPRFMQMLLDGVVRQHGSRVILTTHRPETIISVPASSTFEMQRDKPRIRPVPNTLAVRTLTAGLFTVTTRLRCVLVEDEDDKRFYDAAYRLAVEESAVSPNLSLIFQPVSNGTRRAKESGGRTVVEHWSRKLTDGGLGDLVVGLVDRDASPPEDPAVLSLERYSIENYLLDPIVVFAALLDRRAQPKVHTSTPIYFGSEGLLRTLSSQDLQLVADTVLSSLQSAPETPGEMTFRTVHYFSGQQIELPSWYFSARGKDILAYFQAAYPAVNSFGVQPLVRAFSKTRLIPHDLVATLCSLAG